MKRCCSFILALILNGLLFVPPLVLAQPAGTHGLSTTCNRILSESRRPNSAAGVTLPVTHAPSGRNQEISVLLGESIVANGVQYSCGQIANCLREKYEAQYTASNQRHLIRPNVNADLKLNYSYCLITGEDGLDLLNNYATLVYRWIAGIVGSICILVIIVSGIQISIGGLSQEEVSAAKDRVTRSLMGLVVLFLSAFILYTINPIFFT